MNRNNIFFIVGAQRSGTTYLYDVLEQHPEVCIAEPVKPEPKYFLKKNIEDVNTEEYFKQFYSHCDNKNIIYGEKSTSYYESEESAKLIASFFPKAKIIFSLRNPVQRAISNYFLSVDHNIETRSIEDVFCNNVKPPLNQRIKTSVNPFNYYGRGEYAKYIELYLRYFPAEQIKILIFEELVNSSEEIVRLYDFLNISQKFQPQNIDKVVNASSRNSNVPKSVLINLNNYYKEYNMVLEKLIGKDLSLWQ